MSKFGIEGYVIDTSAWIEFFRDSKQGSDTKDIIYYDSEETITPSIVLAEFRHKYLKTKYDESKFLDDLQTIENLSNIENITKSHSIKAGEIRVKYYKKKKREISFVDCIIIAVGQELDYTIISTDKNFDKIPNCKWLGTPGV